MTYYPSEEHNDELQGYHVITWDDGSEYAGEWMDGLRHGCGKYTDDEGNYYEGSWNYDLKHGFGTYSTFDGHIYEGEHINGLRHGYGVYTWPCGDKYEGNWFKGKKNGYGVYYWSSGDRYEGQWKNNDRHGHGKYISSDGSCMEGRWEEDIYIEEDTDLPEMQGGDYEESDNLSEVEIEFIPEGDKPESINNDELELAAQELIKQGIADGQLFYKDIVCKLQPFEPSVDFLDNFYDRIAEHGIKVVDRIEVEQDEIKDDFFEPSFELSDDDEASKEELEYEDELSESYEGEELEELYYEIEENEIDWGEQLDEEGLLNNIEGVAQSSLNNYEPLLELADINFYESNVFRVLGQPVDASERIINREVKKIKKQLKHNIDIDSSQVIKLPKLPNEEKKYDENLIDKALSRIKNPEYRLIDELFWFWPLQKGDSFNDKALIALKDGDFNKAHNLWNHLEKEGSFVALHNLAVLSLYRVLQMEIFAQKRELKKKHLEAKMNLWQEVYYLWHKCVSNNILLEFLEDRINNIDDPRLKPQLAIVLRDSILAFLIYLNLDIAIKFALDNQKTLAKQQIELITKSGLDETLVERIKLEKASQYLKNVGDNIEAAEKESRLNPAESINALVKLAAYLRKDFSLLEIILTEGSASYQGIQYKKDIAFETIIDIYYKEVYKKTEERAKAEPEVSNKHADKLYEKAKQDIALLKAKIPEEGELINSFSHTIAIVLNNISINYLNHNGDPIITKALLEKALTLALEEKKDIIGDNIKAIDKSNTLAKCCFCNYNDAKDSSVYEAIIYRYEERYIPGTYYKTELLPTYKGIPLPRCPYCKESHINSNRYMTKYVIGGSITGLIVGVIAIFFGSGVGGFLISTIIGVGFGWYLGDQKDLESYDVDYVDCSQIDLPILNEIRKDGWKFISLEEAKMYRWR